MNTIVYDLQIGGKVEFKVIHIKLDAELHRVLRLECADKESSIQNYVANLLTVDLEKSKFYSKPQKIKRRRIRGYIQKD